MSGELTFGLWFLLCGLVGAWRLTRIHQDRDSIAWKLEVLFTLAAFAVAVSLLAFIIYSRVVS